VTLGVRAAILDNRRQVFLVKHTYTPGWHFPGGGVERRETVHAALARELREEAAVTLTGAPEFFGVYINPRLSRRDHVAFYVCREWRQDGAPRVPNVEILDCGFFPLDPLPNGTTEATRHRLAEVLEGAPPSAAW
jgi:8-oxo-dGTP pyrophosphatase MutT (NUDIX family)